MSMAINAMTTTMVREATSRVVWLASLRKMRKRSSTSADEVTSSCEDMVDMIAASTAVSTRPAMSGWNRMRARSRKMVSKPSWSVTEWVVWEKNRVPTKAVKIAPRKQKLTQMMPERRAAVASVGEGSAMNRVTMWGWPK